MAEPPFWNVPNALSLSRLPLSVVLLGLIEFGFFWAALVVFGVAAVTDALDGWLARRWNQTSALGRQLDPLVDKVIVAAAYIYLLAIPGTGVMPWMVSVIVARELLIQGLRSLLEGRGEAFGARWAGKVKTTVQCLSISAILLGLALGLPGDSPWLWVRDALTWAAVGLTLYSGLVYILVALPSLRRREEPAAMG